MDTNVNIVPRGKTFYNGNTIDSNNLGGVELEGMRHTFKDTDPANLAVKGNRGGAGREVTAILVRNVSTIALVPGKAVTYAAGYRQRRVDGYARLTACEVAGVVDDHLPAAGVAVNDLFWLIIDGPVLTKTPLAGGDFAIDIAEGEPVYALTAAASTSTTAGRFQVWNGTMTAAQGTDGSGTKIILNHFARAMSAKTTGNTDTDILIDVKIRR
jgi:hypothetical protein